MFYLRLILILALMSSCVQEESNKDKVKQIINDYLENTDSDASQVNEDLPNQTTSDDLSARLSMTDNSIDGLFRFKRNFPDHLKILELKFNADGTFKFSSIEIRPDMLVGGLSFSGIYEKVGNLIYIQYKDERCDYKQTQKLEIYKNENQYGFLGPDSDFFYTLIDSSDSYENNDELDLRINGPCILEGQPYLLGESIDDLPSSLATSSLEEEEPVSESTIDLPNINNYKNGISCTAGQGRRTPDVTFNSRQQTSGTNIYGPFQPGILEGNISKVYVGASIFGDIITVSQVTSGASVVGYNISFSLCNQSPLIMNNRGISNLDTPSGIKIEDDASCGIGRVDYAHTRLVADQYSGVINGQTVNLVASPFDTIYSKTQCYSELSTVDVPLDQTHEWNNSSYSQFTLIKPKVDFLIMIDNSGSYSYIKPKIEYSLRTLVDHASNNFDSQIAIAPLMGTGLSSEYYVIDEDPSNLINVSNSQLIPLSQAGQKIISFNPGLGKELGFDRTKSLYNDFRNKNIIRADAHQMVVLISNGYHISASEPSPYDITHFAPSKYLEIKNALSNQIHFRFFTIIPHSRCAGVKEFQTRADGTYNYPYRIVSELFHNDVPNSFKSYGTNGDSFDICGSFTNIFESINRTIQPEVLRHTYDHWPLVVTNNSSYVHDNDIDVDNLEVAIIDVNGNERLLQESSTDGFSYIGFRQGLEIRESINGVANRGEAYNGFFIKLNGVNNKVTNPSWIRIRTTTNTHYYGYVKLDYKPDPSSIKLYINGTEIPKSTTNGWEYIGGPTTKNIRIKGVGNYTPVTPAVTKTGWFLKLHGSAIYTNNSSLKVHYFPQD